MTTQIFECVAGSNLFGTAVATSDIDYKGVHIPTARDILLQRANTVEDASTGTKDQANKPGDVDSTSFPLQRYLILLSKMETNAVEMLFAPSLLWETKYGDNIWSMLYSHRHRVLNANKKAFTAFGASQANRYAVRGQRLETLTRICDFLADCNPKLKLSDYFLKGIYDLPGVILSTGTDGIEQMTVFGRTVPVTIPVGEALKVYQKPIKDAGKRSLDAMDSGGADWKGLYHAHRIIDEGIELFSTGGLTFPCKNANEYLTIRSGRLPLEQVLDTFEAKLAALEILEPTKLLRADPDMEWIESFVTTVYAGEVVKNYFR